MRPAVLIAAFACVCLGCDIGLAPVQFDCGPLEAPAPGGGCQRVGVSEASCTIRPDGRGGCEMDIDDCGGLSTSSPCARACPAADPVHPRFPVPCDEFVDADATQFPRVYVDAGYAGGDGDGTIEKPFARIGDALPLASMIEAGETQGAMIMLAEGVYTESLVISGNIFLCGLCADRTIIQGDPLKPTLPALSLEVGFDGDPEGVAPALQFLSVDAPGDGIHVKAWPVDVHSDPNRWAWLYDTRVRANGFGVQAESAGVRVFRSIIERSEGVAIDMVGSTAHVVDSVVRPTGSKDGRGRGIAIRPGGGEVTISGSVIDGQPEVGVHVDGANVTIEDTLIRGAPAGEGGPGIVVARNADASLDARLTLRSSVVERSRDVGVEVVNANASIESTVIRATQGAATSECHGQGLRVLANGSDAFTTTVRESLVEQSRTAGVQVHGATLLMERALVRETLPEPCSGGFGDGVAVIGSGSASIDGSRIEASARAALATFAANASLTATALGCSAVTLAAEPFGVQPPAALAADVSSVCGCAETFWAPCNTSSSGLAPRISAGSACSMLVNDGARRDVINVTYPLPAGEGGAIADGLYLVTHVAHHTNEPGLQGTAVRSKLAIARGTFEYVYSVDDGPEVRGAGAIGTDGADLKLSYDCPAGVAVFPEGPLLPPAPYIATPTTLRIVIVDGPNTWTFTRQP